MNNDLSTHLQGWDYDPAQVKARWIIGLDGRLKVQLRLDLGVLQMETKGRPDGRRPHHCGSVLEYYQGFEQVEGEWPQDATPDKTGCTELQQEALQYYYRYLAFQALRHLEGVIADTSHNMAIVSLVEQRVADERLAWPFLQFFPYIRMMQARAIAEKALKLDRFDKARSVLQEAVEDLRRFWERHGDGTSPPEAPEIETLTTLLGQLHQRRPRSRREQLAEALDRAIVQENYEQAARLRDQLNRLATE